MSKIGKGEWVILFIVTGIIDIIQFAIDFTGVGEAINEVADPIIGIGLAIYFFLLRGVPMNTKRVVSLIGSTVIENVTFSVAPAWILDVWYIHYDVKKEEVAFQAEQESEALLANSTNQPLNQGGIRAPAMNIMGDTQNQPANRGGVRPPGNIQPLASVKNVGSGIDSVRAKGDGRPTLSTTADHAANSDTALAA